MSISNFNYQIVSPNDLINGFEISPKNSFIGLSEISSAPMVDFTASYVSAFSMNFSINQTKGYALSIFIYR